MTVLISIWIGVTACSNKKNIQKNSAQISELSRVDTPSEQLPLRIDVYGKLFDIMHNGNTKSQVSVQQFIGTEGYYGLGAVADLHGEITLWNGEGWLSQIHGDEELFTNNSPNEATLFVGAQVHEWIEIPIPKQIQDVEIDDFILQTAMAHKVNVEEPFPFLVTGQIQKLQWHVIDGKKIPIGVHGHEEHMKSAYKGEVSNTNAKVLGFFSTKHKGIFTHHDRFTHMHIILEEENITGHVDSISLSGSAVLHLPISVE